MKPKNEQKSSLPRLEGKEFDFIRRNAGLTLQKIADYADKLSRSTIYNWRCQRIMKPYQIKILMDMVPEDVFEACRELYREKMEEYEARMKQIRERRELEEQKQAIEIENKKRNNEKGKGSG